MQPWKIETQSVTVNKPDGTPLMTLQFLSDMNDASRTRLRIVPIYPEGQYAPYDDHDGSVDGAVIELEFNTGGALAGSAVYQPRYLKPFERPNLGNPNIRRNVEWRRKNWELGQAGENAIAEPAWNEEWDKKQAEAGHAAPSAVHPEATPESIQAAEAKSLADAAAQKVVRDTQMQQGIPVSPAPHLEPAPVVPAAQQPDALPPQGVTTTASMKPDVEKPIATPKPAS